MKQNKAMRNLILVSGLALAAAGCSKEVIFEGMREDLRSPGYDVNDPAAVAAAREADIAAQAPFANMSRPANLGPAINVASWPQRGDNALNRLPHAAFAANPQLVWSSAAGQGNERKYRITAEPVSDGTRVFTMDSHTTVTGHAIGSGALWSVDITPPGERAGTGSGGGLALGDGKLFATTTFGELVALDPASGNVLWRQKLEGAVNGAPTVAGGLVIVSTANSRGYAVDTDTGRVKWRIEGVPSNVGVSGVAAAAVSGNTVVFPLANGAVIGVDAGNGDLKWATNVPGGRAGSAHAVLQAFTGEPVVADGVIYAATAAGRAVAIGLNDGKVRWTAKEGAQGTMAVAGGSLYFVSDQGKLVRLSARDGAKIWTVDLPHYERADKPRKLKSIWPAYGPVMAGGRLWIASGDGYLRAFNPADGTSLGVVELPAGAASRPIVVAGMMMMMSESGDLIALR